VGDGNSVHGSYEATMELTKAAEQVVMKLSVFLAAKHNLQAQCSILYMHLLSTGRLQKLEGLKPLRSSDHIPFN
jgi:hypothetical protein